MSPRNFNGMLQDILIRYKTDKIRCDQTINEIHTLYKEHGAEQA
jgi:hypothetical protein